MLVRNRVEDHAVDQTEHHGGCGDSQGQDEIVAAVNEGLRIKLRKAKRMALADSKFPSCAARAHTARCCRATMQW
jgi:hypothetical protein